MTNSTTTAHPQGTATHPYVASIMLDPALCDRFHRTFEDRPEVQILRVDRSTADRWTIYAACASQTIRSLLQSNW